MDKQVLQCSSLTVRFYDLDLSSTVFFVNYLKWFDSIAAEDFLRARGIKWEELEKENVDVAIANINFDYKSPLFLNDIVDICIEEVILGQKSMQICGSLYNQKNGKLVATGKVVYVFVDKKTRKPLKVPDGVREKLS